MFHVSLRNRPSGKIRIKRVLFSILIKIIWFDFEKKYVMNVYKPLTKKID